MASLSQILSLLEVLMTPLTGPGKTKAAVEADWPKMRTGMRLPSLLTSKGSKVHQRLLATGLAPCLVLLEPV